MDKEEYDKRWKELKEGENFHRVWNAFHVLSILSYSWSKKSGEPEIGKKIWEGVSEASQDINDFIMEHVPTQDQQRVFGKLADLVNLTFVISAHEKERKEAKKHNKDVMSAQARAAAIARAAREPVSNIKRQVVQEIIDQAWKGNSALSGNVRGTAKAFLDKINVRVAQRCDEAGLPKPDDIKLSAAMDWIRKAVSGEA